jgi:hypothetical protein
MMKRFIIVIYCAPVILSLKIGSGIRKLISRVHTLMIHLKYEAIRDCQIKKLRITSSYRSSLTKSVNGHLFLGFYQNCRNLRSKLVNFKCNVAAFEHIFIILLKTWLTNGIFDNELDLYIYNVFRCDWSSFTSTFTLGGVVLIDVRKYIQSFLITVSE